jgi:hypothetical protein
MPQAPITETPRDNDFFILGPVDLSELDDLDIVTAGCVVFLEGPGLPATSRSGFGKGYRNGSNSAIR